MRLLDKQRYAISPFLFSPFICWFACVPPRGICFGTWVPDFWSQPPFLSSCRIFRWYSCLWSFSYSRLEGLWGSPAQAQWVEPYRSFPLLCFYRLPSGRFGTGCMWETSRRQLKKFKISAGNPNRFHLYGTIRSFPFKAYITFWVKYKDLLERGICLGVESNCISSDGPFLWFFHRCFSRNGIHPHDLFL